MIAEQIEEETKNDVFWHAQFCVRACVRESIIDRALIDVAADGVCQLAGLRVTNLTFILHATCLLYAQAQNCTSYALPCLESVILNAAGNRCAGLCFCAAYISTLLTAPQDGGAQSTVQFPYLEICGAWKWGKTKAKGCEACTFLWHETSVNNTSPKYIGH